MSLKQTLRRAWRPCALLCCISSLATHRAGAEPRVHEPEPNVVNVSGLVPLRELNRAPYSGIWLLDGRFHSLSFGIGIQPWGVRGGVSERTENPAEPRAASFDGRLVFVGLQAAYYVPLVGYTPEFSVGLLPELQASVGSFGGTSQGTIDEHGGGLGTLLSAPVFVMARVGDAASRYGTLGYSLGAGFGARYSTFKFFEPFIDSGTQVSPMLRFEVALGFAQLGYEHSFSSYRPSAHGNLSPDVEISTDSLTFSGLWQVSPDD